MEDIKKQFNIFEFFKNENNQDLCYLDSAATSLTPRSVVDAMTDYYNNHRSNIERSIFKTSVITEKKYNDARQKIASLIDCSQEEIIFTSGATDSANKFLEMFLVYDKEAKLLASSIEHHAVLVPLLRHKNTGSDVTIFDEDNFTVQKYIDYILKVRPNIVYMQLASNVTGEIFDVKKVSEAAHSIGAYLVCDASQAVGHIEVSVKNLKADIVFFSAHKMFGPTGIGALYINKTLLEKLLPVTYGGSAVACVTASAYSLKSSISRFEPGTQNIAGVIGFGAAIDFVNSIGISNIQKHTKGLISELEKNLSKIPGVTIFSAKENVGVVSFSVLGVHPHDIEHFLADKSVAVRSGFFCAETYVRSLSEGPMIRVSVHAYTTKQDIETLVSELNNIISLFSK